MAVNYVCKWAVAAIFIILVTVDNLKAGECCSFHGILTSSISKDF